MGRVSAGRLRITSVESNIIYSTGLRSWRKHGKRRACGKAGCDGTVIWMAETRQDGGQRAATIYDISFLTATAAKTAAAWHHITPT
jgi:hypothetical protein